MDELTSPAKPDTSHVVFNIATQSMICKRCDAVEPLHVGDGVKKLTREGRGFFDRHKFCKGKRRR